MLDQLVEVAIEITINMKKEGFKPHLMYRGNTIKMANSPCAHEKLAGEGFNHTQPTKLTFYGQKITKNN